jgi:hypothetical protein
MPWKRRFEDPVELPMGKIALTLKDAGDYITKLPASQHKHPKWQTAMRVLIEATEGRGPIMHARIGMLQAIQRDAELKYGPGKRVAPATKWGRRKLARDL